jgi:hypothetical protein
VLRFCLSDQSTDRLIEIDDLAGVPEGVFAVEVYVFPTHGADPLDPIRQIEFFLVFGMLEQFGEDAGVEVDDAVGEEAGALAPDLLFDVRPDLQPTGVCIGHGPDELMVRLAPVQRLLHVAPQP